MNNNQDIEHLRAVSNQAFVDEYLEIEDADRFTAALNELEGHRAKDGLPLRHVFKSNDGRVVGLIYGLPSFPSEAEAALIIEWLRGGP